MAAQLGNATIGHLDPELRRSIYEDTIPSRCRIKLGRHHLWNGISLRYEHSLLENEYRWSEQMLVSRLFDEEVREFVCEENIFELSLDQEGESFLEKHFGPYAYYCLTHVHIEIGSTGAFAPASYPVLGTGSTPRRMWQNIAPNLRLLQIVATRPTQHTIRYDSLGLEREIPRWYDWVKGYLQCFATFLSSTAYVEADNCGSNSTKALLKKHLPSANIMPRSRFASSADELDLRLTTRTFSQWQPALRAR